MNYVLVIGILGCAVSCSSANLPTPSPCSSDNIYGAAARCIEKYSLSSQFIRFQTNSTTAQDLKETCEHQENSKQAVQCVINVTAPCVSDAPLFFYEQAIRDSLAYCNDSRINLECLAAYIRNREATNSCINSHRNLTDIKNTSSQEMMCYGRKVIIQCAGELLRPCDAYTATAMANNYRVSTPVLCYLYPSFAG